jgi:hypothetical protein
VGCCGGGYADRGRRVWHRGLVVLSGRHA